MKVIKFAIGFGPKIFHKQGKETEYSLRAIPLGGFVQLEGEEGDSSDDRAFTNKPAWQRILVLLAGVTMNLFLALFISVCIYMSFNQYVTTKISPETDEEILAEYELNVGDTLCRINGEKAYNEEDAARIIENTKSDNFVFTMKDQNGKEYKKVVKIPKTSVGYVGILFALEGESNVYKVVDNHAAAKAGLRDGDNLILVNGQSGDVSDFIREFRNNSEKPIQVEYTRDGERKTTTVTPEKLETRFFNISFIEVKDLDFWHNLYYAWNETKYYFKANMIGLGELLTGHTENVEVQGIVGISSQISKTHSAIEFFSLMSAISLSLGIMNLFPIPGLDGGKILITLIELIRKKPISKKTEATITLIGFSILIGLVVYVTIGDISKLIP